MKIRSPFMVILYGPTAVGKTELALSIAGRIPAEIVNMDVGQFYEPLTIGTAKPDWRSLPIKHHLFDIVHHPRNITVIEYRTLLVQTLREIWDRGNMPIVVGGSGFYLKTIFFPPSGESAPLQYDVSLSSEQLWQELFSIDPERAEALHPQDLYRIKRALSIWYATGKKPSEHKAVFDPLCPFFMLGVMRERVDLYARINQRVFEMLDSGWVEETRRLLGTEWEEFLKTKKIIGYDDIIHFLYSAQTENDKYHMINRIQQRTRNYAKQQISLWRGFEKILMHAFKESTNILMNQSEVDSINLTLLDHDLYINQLLEKLVKYFNNT